MPTYEYTCNDCRRKFETLVRSSKQKVECPHCGGRKVTKLFSVFGAHTGASGPGAAPV